MNKNCAFTICTRSYIGLANTLKHTFLKYNEEFDFFIILCDGETNQSESIISGCEIVSLGKEKYEELAFKYNVTEFCTCIKPFGFSFFFRKDYKTVAYFDPDIMFFSRFNELYDDYSVYLTPHIINPQAKTKNDWEQEQFLKYGVYNCGFVGLCNDYSGRLVAKWWSEQLLSKAFVDPAGGLYTDQKWMDMVPSFIDLTRINVIKNMGCDFAPWNYAERTVEKQGSVFYAVSRDDRSIKNELVFVHYSAYNYRKLLADGIIESKYNLSEYPEINELIFEYERQLNNCNTLESLSLKYKYNEYENGEPILPFHRRLFRVYMNSRLQCYSPFSCNDQSFYSILKKSKLLVKKNNSQHIKNTISSFDSKTGIINRLYKLMFNVFGIEKYILFLGKSGRMSRYEENIFLLKIPNS